MVRKCNDGVRRRFKMPYADESGKLRQACCVECGAEFGNAWTWANRFELFEKFKAHRCNESVDDEFKIGQFVIGDDGVEGRIGMVWPDGKVTYSVTDPFRAVVKIK